MKEITTALIKAQTRFKPLQKTAKNPFFKSNYATLDNCIDATRDALVESGLCIVQPTTVENGVLMLKTILLHISGENIVSLYPIVPSKPDPQGYGSALTYARRYCYCAILSLVADEDDDGNESSKPSHKPVETPKSSLPYVISAAQLKRLQTLANESKKEIPDVKAILLTYGYTSSKDIKISDYDKICTEITTHHQGE